jgi:hypothetical protein
MEKVNRIPNCPPKIASKQLQRNSLLKPRGRNENEWETRGGKPP